MIESTIKFFLQKHSLSFPHGGAIALSKLLGYLSLEPTTKTFTFTIFIRNLHEHYLTAFANHPHKADSLNLFIVESLGIIPRALLQEYHSQLLPTFSVMEVKQKQFGWLYSMISLPMLELDSKFIIPNTIVQGLHELVEFIPRICVEFIDRNEIYIEKSKINEIFPLRDP